MHQILQGREREGGLREGFIGEVVLYQDVKNKQRCLPRGHSKKVQPLSTKAWRQERPSKRTNRKTRHSLINKYWELWSFRSRIDKSTGNFPLVSPLFCTFQIFYNKHYLDDHIVKTEGKKWNNWISRVNLTWQNNATFWRCCLRWDRREPAGC